MSLNASELETVAAELNGLTGARVQKAYAPGPRTSLLELRQPGRTAWLLLEAEPSVGRACVVTVRPASPQKPSAFQGLLRRHLTGARLDGVDAYAASRTLCLRLTGPEGERQLVLEIATQGGEILLLDERQRVLGVGRPGSARGLKRSDPYRPPEGASHPRPSRFPPGAARDPAEPFPVSRAIERHYVTVDDNRRLTLARTQSTAPLKAARRRLARTVDKVRADLARVSEAERFRRFGDLLKPELHGLKRGASEARVTEYDDSGAREVLVPLLPQLSPLENMQRYYHQHRRLGRSAELVTARLTMLEDALARLDSLLGEAAAAEDEAQLASIQEQAQTEGAVGRRIGSPAKAANDAPRRPFREFRTASGRPLWVGRNARDNDALTFRHARGNDLWLHARAQTGSHVVVPGTGAEPPDGETLLDAATLAAHFSAARGETLVDVSATRRKYVQKPKGAAPGAVRFSQERTVALRLDSARLERLLASELKRG